MKVHLAILGEMDLLTLFQQHASFSRRHELESNPSVADLILFLGYSSSAPQRILQHELYGQFPWKCAVYSEDDLYLPLLPGVYCSAARDKSTRVGRAFNFSYVSSNNHHRNHYLDASFDPSAGITAEKRYLFTFLGGSTSILRKRLFNIDYRRNDVLIENTSTYLHWDNSQADRLDRQRRYAEIMRASHFVLCPRGAGVGSMRFFEVMEQGIAPVLLSDSYELPPGPAWDKFLLRVREHDIIKLPMLLEPRADEAVDRGRLAREAFVEYFSVERDFDCIVDRAALSLQHNSPSEAHFRGRQAIMIRRFRWRASRRAALRAVALGTLKALHLKNPYQMNRMT